MVEALANEVGDRVPVLSWNGQVNWENGEAALAEEISLTIFLDGVELATLMCSPGDLNFLVAGFLRSERLIERLDDIAMMRVCDDETFADVRLMRPHQVPTRRILTAGCGSGITFDQGASLEPVDSTAKVTPESVLSCMRLLQQLRGGRRQGGGTHLSALSDGRSLLVTASDIGRHNTLDKIWGECLFRQIGTEGKLLLTTGRLSSEMATKAARMGIPVIASLNSPTHRTVLLAERLRMTVIGYARGSRLSVYSHPERLL